MPAGMPRCVVQPAAVAGAVVALALRCRLSIEKSPEAFDGTFNSMIKRTAEDVKNTVVNIGQEPVEDHA